MDSVENGPDSSETQTASTPPSYPLPQRVYSLSERLPRSEPFGKGDPFGTQPPPAEIPESTGPTFWDHISELRKRLLLAFVGVVIGGAIAYAFWQRLWTMLAYPLTKQHLHVDFIATSPLESFVTSLKLSLMAGLVISFPWVMWQFWRFLAPALYQKEKSLFLGAFFGSVLMFICGAAFAFGVVLPAGLHFLATYASDSVVQNWKQADYASFISQFLLAFGLIFELPIVIFVLAKLGLVTARGLWSFFRFALIIIFVVAAFLTPGPDPVSQVLLALPLCVLYLISIGVAAWVQPKEGET